MRTIRTLSTAAALLLAATAAQAQAPAAKPAAQPAAKPAARKTATPPPAAPLGEIRFPEFQEKTLANGLRVVVVEQHEQPLVSLRLVVKGGRSWEPEGKAGLAQATAALLTQGTASRSAQQIAETIDFVGGSVGAQAGLESSYATASVTSDQLDLGFELLSDIVLHPTFPQEELERWRRQSLSGLQIQQQTASYLAGRAVERLAFGQHPYGRPAAGTPESLRGLTRDDIVAFHQRQYVPNGSFLAVVGDVRPDDAFARAERAFGSWAKGGELTLAQVPTPAFERNPVVVIDKPDAVQTEIRIAQVAIPFRDPDLYAAEVYSSVAGASPSSRLYGEIRQKRGLSYGASSSFVEATQPGWFEASTFTKTETTVEALKVALDVLRDLQKEPVPASELNDAKTYITGAFPLEIETADGIADRVLEAMKYGYGREFLESYNQKIAAVSAADLQRFARERMRPDRMAVAVVGNASVFADELKKSFPDVRVIPVDQVDFLRADLRRPQEAQSAPAGPADPKALDLLRQAQEALGGKAFTGQKSQVAKGAGTISPPGMPQPMQVPSIVNYRVYPDKVRSELQLPMGTMTQGFDGTTGWAGNGSQTQDTTAQAKAQQPYGFDVLRRAGEAGWTARLLPDAQVDGKPTQVVELADAGGHATRFYLDPQSHLVLKIGFDAGGQTSEALYSDYRDVKGVKVPFQTTLLQNGDRLIDIKYSDVQVDVPVDEALFKKPGA